MSTASYVNIHDPQSPFDVAPIGGRIGAEIRGVQLSGDLDDAAIVAIRAALVRHKVIFFRDQQMDDAGHEAFAARFGEPFAHPAFAAFTQGQGPRYLIDLNSTEGYSASTWHTDATFAHIYPGASILRGIIVPEAGGDTLFANTVTAYDDLPEPLKRLADGLWAIHSNAFDYVAEMASSAAGKQLVENFSSTTYEAEHPVVHVHPVSGERALLLGNFFKVFVGLNRSDSQNLFERLQMHITKPENTMRWRWRAGDVAIWDNRATQHRAIADFGTQPRHHRRATIAGSVAVSIDGRHSRAVRPAPEAMAQAAE